VYNCTAAEEIAEPPARRRVVCYPVHLATPAPLPAAIVERKEQGEMTTLTFRGDTQRLNTPYFHKLVSARQYLSLCWCTVSHFHLHCCFITAIISSLSVAIIQEHLYFVRVQMCN